MSTKLLFGTPEEAGQHKMWLYLISDSYLGLDQQYEMSYTCAE